MPVISEQLILRFDFEDPNHKATRLAKIYPLRDSVSDIPRHYFMVPTPVKGAEFGIPTHAPNDRLLVDGESVQIQPPLAIDERMEYKVTFSAELDTTGEFQWPVRHPTEHIVFEFNNTDGLNWTATLITDQSNVTLTQTGQSPATVFEYNNPPTGSVFDFQWSRPELRSSA